MSPNNNHQYRNDQGRTTIEDRTHFHNITYSPTKDKGSSRIGRYCSNNGDAFTRGPKCQQTAIQHKVNCIQQEEQQDAQGGKVQKLWKNIKSTLQFKTGSTLESDLLDDPPDLTVSGNFTNLYIKPDECLPKASDLKNNNFEGSVDELQDDWKISSANIVHPNTQKQLSGKLHRTFTFKVLVIGDPCTGKTSLIHRYVAGEFMNNYKATLGVDFALKVVRWSDNVTVKLQLWDIAGQERFTSMTRVYYKDAHACVIMFDLSQRSSFLNALKWKKDLDMKCSLPDGNPVPCILLANKCDLGNRDVKQEEIEGLCQEQDFIGWTETSVKQGLMVEESMRFLLDDMIARYAERNPGLTDSQALDMDRKSNVSLIRDSEGAKRSNCAC